MIEILIKDPLRDAVEKASGGKQTVLWTKSGFPTHMNIISQVRLEDLHPSLGTGPHPAFIVDGVEKSEIFIGTYHAVIQDGEAISLPNQPPATCIDFDDARAACAAAGPGFHLMTNYEWAFLALSCAAAGHDVRGNTKCGRSHTNQEELGKKIGGSNLTLTGSGPASWRHDGTPFGIADLVGNVWEWCDGLKLRSGQIVMPRDNDYTLLEAQWPDAGACVDIVDSHPRIAEKVTTRDYDSVILQDMVVNAGFEVPIALRQALLCPSQGIKVSGRFWADNTEDFEALPFRGGGWGSGSLAGRGALVLDCERSDALSLLGFRPAFIG